MASPWIIAARLKTLPLAISGILLGSALAYLNNKIHWNILYLGISTALILQILSNFANDYGDYVKGTDGLAKRNDRMLAAGKISPKSMLVAMVVLAALALASGIALLYEAQLSGPLTFYIFLSLGIAAILAAVAYTVGKHAFGYYGLGDLVVMVFFGFASVGGIYFLHAAVFGTEALLASLGCGLLSVAVLNVNNLRDIESDRSNQKKTVPVRMGKSAALMYHKLLIWLGTTSILLSFLYHIQNDTQSVSPWEFALVAGVFSPIFILMAGHVSRLSDAVDAEAKDSKLLNEETRRAPFNKELKALSLTVLLAACIYWLLVFLYN